MQYAKEQILWGVLRLSMGWIFLWPFLDKLFGFGFATEPDKSWLAGSSPTLGFLKFGTNGPFSELFQSLAGNPVVDWLFMLGLLAAGLGLILGIMVRLAAWGGIMILLLIYLAALPPEHNPFLDEHLIYILILIGISITRPSQWFGLGKWWTATSLVQRRPWLE
ncbi:MAG: TQO small subunit DoxD [Patescibacteria group bacterium]